MNRIAVITDIHGNLPALEASLAAIDAIGVDEIYCGGDLVGYGPHPNEVCALIEERGIPTIYGNYDYAIARDLDDCGCAYVTQHDRELGQQSVAWTLAHTDQRVEGLHARAAVRSALRARRPGRPSRARLAAEGQRVPVRGQARQPVRAARDGRGSARCSCSGTPTSPGSTPTAGCCSSTAGRSANRRTATRAPRSRSSKPTTQGPVRASIERVPYDAEAVAREVAAAGLPGRVRREAGAGRIAKEARR